MKNEEMNRRFGKTLYLVLLLVAVLAACGGDDDSDTAANNDRAAPDAAVNTSGNAPAPNVEVTYDPGPYFTPRRVAPENPQSFVPDEQIGAFRRTTLTGSCTDRNGMTGQYVDEASNIVYLQCQYLTRQNSAADAIEALVRNNVLTGQPIVIKLQGAESFLLGTSGQAYVFAWTHEHWFFLVRSLYGRAALDAFMEAFPY